MTDQTPLDAAHAAMTATEDDDTLRLRFYERVADSELFILLKTEPEADHIDPRLFPVDGTGYLLAFDREERLAAFAEATVPYAALSGRALVGMIAGQGIGLGLNLGTASETLLPPESVHWLAGILAHKPGVALDRPAGFGAPRIGPKLLAALTDKLVLAAGMAQGASLVSARYHGGREGHLLAFIGADPAAETALSQAVSEALIFADPDPSDALDVAFLAADDPLTDQIIRLGLRFDLPAPVARPTPTAPGTDPTKPPRLR